MTGGLQVLYSRDFRVWITSVVLVFVIHMNMGVLFSPFFSA